MKDDDKWTPLCEPEGMPPLPNGKDLNMPERKRITDENDKLDDTLPESLRDKDAWMERVKKLEKKAEEDAERLRNKVLTDEERAAIRADQDKANEDFFKRSKQEWKELGGFPDPRNTPEGRKIAQLDEARRNKANGEAKPEAEKPEDKWPPLIRFTELDMETAPTRDWAIRDWVPKGSVTLLAGGSGTGKSLLVQAMGSSVYMKRTFLDMVPRKMRVLLWMCEDNYDELWRRQVAIARQELVTFDVFGDGYFVRPLDGVDVELASPGTYDNRQRLMPSTAYVRLREEVADLRADLVVLDTSARLYGGNENDRHQVTQFISLLTSVANIRGSAVVLCAHPAKAKGSEWSGSTAWEASCRSRLFLSRELPGKSQEEDEDEIEPLVETGIRYLSRRKSNYSALDVRRLQIVERMVMVPDPPPERIDKAKATPEFRQEVVSRGIRHLTGMKESASSSERATNYLPKMLKKYGLTEGLTDRELRDGMVELQKAGRLVNGELPWRSSSRNRVLGLVLKEEGVHNAAAHTPL